MAKSRAGFAKTKSQNYSTKWLRNAMKSIGISTSQVIQEISPNLYEVSKSGFDTSRNLVSSMKKNTGSVNRVSEQLKSNKYVRFAQSAYKNALIDLKTGNLNNQDRMAESMSGDMSFGDLEDLGEGFSFGDDGADNNVNVNVINQSGGNNEAIMKISDQMQRNAVGQAKMQKANMDAYIAVSAAGMQQVSQVGAEIVSQLTNVNSNLAALVQYNNQNMTKFIEASMAYYDKVGSASGSASGSTNNGKVSAKDVLNSSNGGISMSQYKTYVKQQFKDMVDKSDVGLVKSLMTDDMLSLAASNPLGFMTTSLTRYMMPKILKTSLESMETTFSNFMPTMLSQLADLADSQGSDIASKLKRAIGQTFGLKIKRINTMDKASVNREAIPFDGETKHAITEIITKELREQTGYLQIIANHYDKNAKATMKSKQEYWSYKQNGYVKQDQINSDIANEIVDAITGAFNDNKFGKALMDKFPGSIRGNDARSNANRAEYDNTVKEIFAAIEKSEKTVDLPFLIELINNTGADKTTKRSIINYIKKLHTQDPDTFQSVNVGRLRAQSAANEAKNRILKDAGAYHLNDSKFTEKDENGKTRNVDDVINEIMNWGPNAKGRRATRKVDTKVDSSNAQNNGSFSGFKFNLKDIKGSIKGVSDSAVGIMRSLMNGDAKGVLSEGASFISNEFSKITTKAKLFFLGDKDTEGKYTNGILSSIANDTKDNFKKIGNDIKDGVMEKLFGRVKNSETGKYEKSKDGNGGVFGHLTGIFKKGIDGWTDAFFGTNDENRKDTQTKITDYIKKAAPAGITGAAIGAGVGVMTGGSLLGMLVGGPIAGAGMGAAMGFLSKNEKFQNWLFGEKDKETGERAGGFISKKTQDYFKKNKSFMLGSAAVGAVSGTITGGGLLGTLVGGPVAGALIGMAGGIVTKSGVFERFLFGDQEKGQKGLVNGVKDAWNKHFKGSKDKDDKNLMASGAKAIGMSATGTVAGGLIGSLMGGPVLGAIAGFGLSMKAQAGNFKEWLFGKDDGLSLGNGKKTKKQGVIGMIGNSINANILKPMKTQFKYMADDAMNVLEHKVLAPFAFAAEFAADKLGGIASKISDGAKTTFGKITKSITGAVGKMFSPITKAVGKTMEKATDFAYGAFKKVVTTPGAIISATIKTLKLKERIDNLLPVKAGKAFVKDVRNLIIKGIKGLFKGIFNVITSPFRLVWAGVKKLGSKVKEGFDNAKKKIGNIKIGGKKVSERVQGIKDKFNGSEWYKNFQDALKNGGGFGSLKERMKANAIEYKQREEDILKQREENKRHDKNAKLIEKATHGQFSEDTDEARTWLKYHNEKAFNKLNGTSITYEAEIEKNGLSTKGMSSDEIAKANIKDLSPEAQQVKFLQGIFNFVKAIYDKAKGKDISSNETVEEAADREKNEAEQKSNKEKEERKKYIEIPTRRGLYRVRKEDGAIFKEGNEVDIDDAPKKVRKASLTIKEEKGLIKNEEGEEKDSETEGNSSFTDKIGKRIENFKNYFKTDFFSNTRKLFSNKSDTEQAVDEAASQSGENVGHKSIGGFLKKGLTLVGEKGAELLNLTDDGAEILSNDDTSDAAEEVNKSKKNKRHRKLADFFRRRKKKHNDDEQSETSSGNVSDALEMQSDEKLRTRLKNAALFSSIARTTDEKRRASAEQNAALIAKREDMSSDSQAKANKNAKTADELRKEAEEQKFRDQQLKNQNATIDAIKDTSKSTDSFKKLWSGIFSKKGLITAAAILGFSWLKKNLPGLFKNISNIASKIASFVGSTVSDVVGDFLWTEQNNARTDGNTAAEQLEKNVSDIKNGNILTDSSGNATHQTQARTNLLARTALNFANSGVKTKGSSLPGVIGKNARITNAEKKVFNATKKVGSGVKKAGKRAAGWFKDAGTIAGMTTEYGDEAYELATGKGQKVVAKGLTKVKNSKVGKAATKMSTGISNGTSKVKSKMLSKADDMAKLVAEKASKNDGALSTIATYLEKFFKLIKDKFAKKAGTELADNALKFSPSSLIKNLKEAGNKAISKLITKVTGKVATGTTVAAVTAGISEAVFASIGALNGVSGTAKLFQVSSDEVDGTMKLISGIFGALTGTTLGSIIDVILSFIGDIIGVDILHSLAVSMYKVIVGFDSKKAKKLDSAQSEWKDAYKDERDKKIEEQYNTQKKAGIIGENVTYEMFEAGLEDGTYSASYDSFNDWNTKKNASFGDKITSGIGKGFKSAKWGLKKAGKALFGGADSYTDKNGNVYTENKDGTYQVTSANGEDLGYVDKKSIDLDSMTKNKSEGLLGKGAKLAAKGLKKAGKGLKKIGKSIWNKSILGASVNFATNIKEKGIVGAAKDAFGKTYLGKGAKLAAKGLKKAGKGLKNFFTKDTEVCYYSTDGSYYTADGKHYSANGDEMDSISITELSQMIASGELKEGEKVTRDSGFSKAITKARKALSTGWNNVKSFVTSTWSNLKNKASKMKDKAVNTAKKIAKNTKNFFVSHTEKAWYDTDGSYYVSDGKSFIHYNATGDVISDGISADEFESICNSGQLTEGEAKVDSGLKKGLKSLKSKVTGVWDSFTKKVSDNWDTVKEKASSAVTKVKSFVKDKAARLKKFIVGKTTTAWYDNDGSYYVANGESFIHYSANGDVIEDSVDADAINDAISSGSLTEGKIQEEAGWKTTLRNMKDKISGAWDKATTSLQEGWDSIKNTAGKFMSDVKEAGGLKSYIKGVFKTTKTKGWFDTNGSYYVLQSNGTYTYFNANGDEVKTNVPASEVEDMIKAGLLTAGDVIKDSKAKEAVKSIKKAVKGAWSKAKKTVTSAWDSFKSFIGGGDGEGSTDAAFNTSKKNQGGSGRFVSGFIGGRGKSGDQYNGASYFSQNDSRWASKAYNMGQDNATMSDTGCGPTAMAMAVNTARNSSNVTPTDMANIAKITGNRDDTGTNSNFINESAAIMGVNSEERINPSAMDIKSQVSSGNPVVLLGQSDGSGSNPYTSAGHYVVAVGQKPNGDIIVNDPRGKSYSRSYNPLSLAKSTGTSWTIGNRRRRKGGTGKRRRFGGYGTDTQVIKSSDVVNAAQNEIGYLEKSSDANLDDPKADPGTGNYTKFGRDMSQVFGHPAHDEWCATFVCWCFWKAAGENKDLAAAALHGATTAGCSANRSAFQSANAWIDASQTPKAGYVIFYDYGHTGIVTGADDSYVYTVEGNTGGGNDYESAGEWVYNKQRSKSDSSIMGYGVPILDVDVNVTNPTPGATVAGTSTSSESSSSSDKISQLTSFLGSFASEFGTRVLTGDFKNTDYSSVLSGVTNTGTSSDSSSTNSSGFASTSGSDTKAKVWDFFRKNTDMPDTGIAGILGNMRAESGVNPKNLQDSYESSLGYSDDEYTQAVDNGSYNNFADDSAGYGLVQFTYNGYKQGLLDYAKQHHLSIGSEDAQLNYLYQSIKDTDVWNSVKNASSAGDAAKQWMLKYERPADQSEAKQNARAEWGEEAYNERPEGGSGAGISKRNRYRVNRAAKLARGGYGASVDSNRSISSTTSDRTGYTKTYIKTTKSNSTQELLVNAIEILAIIASNTADASVKLNALNKLKTLSISGGNNASSNKSNTAKSSNNSNGHSSSGASNDRNKNSELTARAIARGGY